MEPESSASHDASARKRRTRRKARRRRARRTRTKAWRSPGKTLRLRGRSRTPNRKRRRRSASGRRAASSTRRRRRRSCRAKARARRRFSRDRRMVGKGLLLRLRREMVIAPHPHLRLGVEEDAGEDGVVGVVEVDLDERARETVVFPSQTHRRALPLLLSFALAPSPVLLPWRSVLPAFNIRTNSLLTPRSSGDLFASVCFRSGRGSFLRMSHSFLLRRCTSLICCTCMAGRLCGKSDLRANRTCTVDNWQCCASIGTVVADRTACGR